MSQTIRTSIVDSINELNKVMLAPSTTDEDRSKIRGTIQALFISLDKVLIKSLDAESSSFKEALAQLKKLTQDAKDAQEDVNKVAATITQATKVINKIENLVGQVAGVLTV